MKDQRRVDMIRERLETALSPRSVHVVDESHWHTGHAGARDGRGHFSVTVVSAAFDDKSLIQRHRMVYEALGDAMQTDIHALSIDARTPEETRGE